MDSIKIFFFTIYYDFNNYFFIEWGYCSLPENCLDLFILLLNSKADLLNYSWLSKKIVNCLQYCLLLAFFHICSSLWISYSLDRSEINFLFYFDKFSRIEFANYSILKSNLLLKDINRLDFLAIIRTKFYAISVCIFRRWTQLLKAIL